MMKYKNSLGWRVKKHANQNEYIRTDTGIWVRNFDNPGVPYSDINNLTREEDYALFLKNEIVNAKSRSPWVDGEDLRHNDVVIVSDGHRFKEVQGILARLDKRVAIMAVNGALARWTAKERTPTFYVVNNPYPECLHYLPRGVFPRCLASTRTHHEFLAKYRGVKYRYMPVADAAYTGPKSHEVTYQVDDYRNPVCAAINLCYHFGVQRLLLACCDGTFATERPGAERLPNGLFQYPQQRIPQSLAEANLHWFKKANPDAEVRNVSDGLEYKMAAYISPDNILDFFQDDNA